MNWVFRLLAKLLDPGSGVELTQVNTLTFQSWLPFWTFPFLAAAIFAVITWLYHRAAPRISRTRRLALIILRSLALIGLLTILARPSMVILGEGVRNGPVPVIVDGTLSMTIQDAGEGSRAEAALRINQALREEGEDIRQLELHSFWAGREFSPLEPEDTPEADDDTTSLPVMLDMGLNPFRGEYIPGVILITDGAHNTPDSVDRAITNLRNRNIPVYTVGVGAAKADDVAVNHIVGDDILFLTEKAKVFVNLTQNGYDGQRIRLRLFMDDREVYSGSHVLDGEEINVPVEFQPFAKGTFQLRAHVEPLAGEITEENNTYIRTVRVIDEQMRILLMFGLPSWEYRFLAGALERDRRVTFEVYMPTVDPRVFTQGTGGRFIQTLPENAEEIGKKYDAIFISGISPTQLPAGFVEGLPEFIENSGGLALISDPAVIPFALADTPWEVLLPMLPGRMAPRSYRDELLAPLTEPLHFHLTEDGEAHPLVTFSGDPEENREVWRSLPPIYRHVAGGRLKPSALTLLVTFRDERGQDFPAIVMQAYGKGSVLYMGFDSTWRWRREVGDRYFRDFWGRAVQYLALPHLLNEAAQSVLLTANETAYTGERLQIRARVSNADFSPYTGEQVPLTLELDGERREIGMLPVAGRTGMYRAEFVPATAGTLQLSLPERFNATPLELRVMTQQREFRNAELHETLLRQIAEQTGGAYYEEETVSELLRTLLEGRPRESIRLANSLWDSTLLFLIVLILLSAEWILRKASHLD